MNTHLLALVRQNFIAKAAYFARQIPQMTFTETDHYAFVDTGLPTNTFNVAVPKTNQAAAIHELFTYHIRQFVDKGSPVALWCWEDTRSPLLIQLAQHYIGG